MQPIVYDVAVSADGYICAPQGDVSLFPHEGDVVADYLARLESYAVALMGRGTYAFGLAQGLPPGANPYPHLRSIVLSSSLEIPEGDVELWREADTGAIRALAREAPGPVYLCGGGHLAGWMMRAGLIDVLRLKRAPVLCGGGVPLFEGGVPKSAPALTEERCYEGGVVYQEFDLRAA